jgi:hypothetical protein
MYDSRIDEALDSLPLVPLPVGFTSRVLAKIEHPQMRFRLTFLDLALPAFFTLFTSIIVGAAVWVYTTMDPLWPSRFILFLQLTWLEIRVFPYLPLLGCGAILLSGLGVGLLGLALWILPPRLNRLVSAV